MDRIIAPASANIARLRHIVALLAALDVDEIYGYLMTMAGVLVVAVVLIQPVAMLLMTPFRARTRACRLTA